jgi:hypothetical protein
LTDLQSRLQRLKRPGEPAPGAPTLERLEQEMLGVAGLPTVGENLSLKARLERLVAVAAL